MTSPVQIAPTALASATAPTSTASAAGAGFAGLLAALTATTVAPDATPALANSAVATTAAAPSQATPASALANAPALELPDPTTLAGAPPSPALPGVTKVELTQAAEPTAPGSPDGKAGPKTKPADAKAAGSGRRTGKDLKNAATDAAAGVLVVPPIPLPMLAPVAQPASALAPAAKEVAPATADAATIPIGAVPARTLPTSGMAPVPAAELVATAGEITPSPPLVQANAAAPRNADSDVPDISAALPPGPGGVLPSVTAPAPAVHAPAVTASAETGSTGLARQLAPAFVQLSHGASGNAVTLQLDPGGLGHVQVRIDRDNNGTATVQVTAEHPETLRMLVADQPHLHRALDNAGLAADGRSLSFALATPGGGTFSGAENGSSGGRQGGGRSTRSTAQAAGSGDDSAFITQPAWIRAGVDITA